jgi:hypothetical protein
MSRKKHPNLKATFEKLIAQAAARREEHTQAHGGVFDIHEFAKEHGVTSINHTGDSITIRASDDTHQTWECDIPVHHSEDAQRFILAILTGWVLLRGENSPTEFTINDPTSRTGDYDSLEEGDAELFAYALMIPEKALDDASITPLYDGRFSKLAEAVRGVKEELASKLGVPPIIVWNYTALRWALYQAKMQESFRASLEAAREKRLARLKRKSQLL